MQRTFLRPQALSDNRRKGKKYSRGLGQHPHKYKAFRLCSGHEVRVRYVYFTRTTDALRCRKQLIRFFKSIMGDFAGFLLFSCTGIHRSIDWD